MKTAWVIRRLFYIIRIYPKRLARLFTYYRHPFYAKPTLRAFPLILAECFLFFDLYEIITTLLKSNIRPLTDAEILRGAQIFGKSIDFQLVMMDDDARLWVRDKVLAYVSFNTINTFGVISADVFIHELVHIWQYQNFGAGYISQALSAQLTKEGYNYTDITVNGVRKKHWFDVPSIYLFNAEQQGDLVQDYFRLKTGLRAQWECGWTMMDLGKYERFIDEVRGEMGH